MIYCLEDDSDIRELLLYALGTAGFEAVGFAPPAAFWEALEMEVPSLILLDIMLPGEDGISVLKRLRKGERTRLLPVIMTTARGTEFDKVTCLDLGADDYLVKPFGMMELLARVRSVLRRSEKPKPAASPLTFGALALYPEERKVTLGGAVLAGLTYKEFELLRLFLEHPKQVFSRDALYDRIWGCDYVGESRTVDMHIKTLRKKLLAYGECIETVRNVGYRLREAPPCPAPKGEAT